MNPPANVSGAEVSEPRDHEVFERAERESTPSPQSPKTRMSEHAAELFMRAVEDGEHDFYSERQYILKPDFYNSPYPGGDVFQKRIFDAPIDPNSVEYLAALVSAGGASPFVSWMPPQEFINLANSDTPMVPVAGINPGHRIYPTTMPFDPAFIIQKPGTDQHYAVLNQDTGMYYESFMTSWDGTSLKAYSNLAIDLHKPWTRPPVGGNSTSTGIPFGLLAIRPEEIVAGHIKHALGWDGIAGTWAQTASVSPAGVAQATDGHVFKGTGTPLPYGSHARLKASFDESKLTPTVRTIAQAMKHFGLFCFDTGSANVVEMVRDSTGTISWTQADSDAMATISPLNFDILVPPA